MKTDEQFQLTQKALKAKGQKALTKEERLQRQRALDDLGQWFFNFLVVLAKKFGNFEN